MFEKDGPPPRPTRPLVKMSYPDAKRHPLDNHELRRDFSVRVAALTGKAESDGRLVLAPGDNKLRLKVEVARDAFVSVWSVKKDGTVAEVFPGPQGGAVLLRAGKPRELPPPDKAPLTLTYSPTTADKPDGQTYLYVLASSTPLDLPATPGVGVLANLPPAHETPDQKKRLQELLQRTRPSPGPTPPGGGTQISEALLPVLPR